MEITIHFFDKAYQYKTLVVKDTTRNNLYSGVISELKKEVNPEFDLWAEARSSEGDFLFRVKQHKYAKDSYLVGLILEPYLITWMDPELLEPDYKLEVIHKH